MILPMSPSPEGVDGVAGDLVCSAKGCTADATSALLWNNPRLHTPTRRKVWLACDDHRDELARFLELRGFLRDVVPVSELEVVEP